MFGNNKKESLKAQESIERIKLIRTIILIAVFMVVIICVLIIALRITSSTRKEPKPQLTSTTINQQLANCSKLTTAELTYNGLVRFSEGDIPLINQNSFSMIYTATATAGIDISKAESTVTDTEIIITLPPCEVQEINVNPDSLEFFDEKTSLFNPSKKTDVVTAIQYAENDVKTKADLDSLINRAKSQTELIINGIIKPIAEGRNITIHYNDINDTHDKN